MFAVGLSREGLLEELARIGETLRCGVWKACKRIYVFRTRNCITFRCENSTNNVASTFKQPIIQVILRNHSSLAHVLNGFDLVGGTCAARSQALAHFPLSPRKL
jgi:hypothetical protein